MCGHCWDLWPGPIQVACPQQTRNLLAAPVLALLALLLMVLALVERTVPVRLQIPENRRVSACGLYI